MLEQALERLTDSPLVGTMASRFMGRIAGEVLQANRAVADKVPGLGSLMSFGTSAASKMMGAADKQFEALIGDTVGKGGTFAVRRLNRILLDTLHDPTTREAAPPGLGPAGRRSPWPALEHAETRGAGLRRGGGGPRAGGRRRRHRAHRRSRRGRVDTFLDRFGGYTPAELLDELGLDREDVVADLARVAPGILDALRRRGELERLLRGTLEPFYASPEVRALLAE